MSDRFNIHQNIIELHNKDKFIEWLSNDIYLVHFAYKMCIK